MHTIPRTAIVGNRRRVPDSFVTIRPTRTVIVQTNQEKTRTGKAVQAYAVGVCGIVTNRTSEGTLDQEAGASAQHDGCGDGEGHLRHLGPVDHGEGVCDPKAREAHTHRCSHQREDQRGGGAHGHAEGGEDVQENRVDDVDGDVDGDDGLQAQSSRLEDPLADRLHDRRGEGGPQHHGGARHVDGGATAHDPGAEDRVDEVGGVVPAHLHAVPDEHSQADVDGDRDESLHRCSLARRAGRRPGARPVAGDPMRKARWLQQDARRPSYDPLGRTILMNFQFGF
jgi:hypothetical protein